MKITVTPGNGLVVLISPALVCILPGEGHSLTPDILSAAQTPASTTAEWISLLSGSDPNLRWLILEAFGDNDSTANLWRIVDGHGLDPGETATDVTVGALGGVELPLIGTIAFAGGARLAGALSAKGEKALAAVDVGESAARDADSSATDNEDAAQFEGRNDDEAGSHDDEGNDPEESVTPNVRAFLDHLQGRSTIIDSAPGFLADQDLGGADSSTNANSEGLNVNLTLMWHDREAESDTDADAVTDNQSAADAPPGQIAGSASRSTVSGGSALGLIDELPSFMRGSAEPVPHIAGEVRPASDAVVNSVPSHWVPNPIGEAEPVVVQSMQDSDPVQREVDTPNLLMEMPADLATSDISVLNTTLRSSLDTIPSASLAPPAPPDVAPVTEPIAEQGRHALPAPAHQAPVQPPPPRPLVPGTMAVLCALTHPNPMGSQRCRRCGGQIPPQEPQRMIRPVVGHLKLASGHRVALDRNVVIGRAPEEATPTSDVMPVRIIDPHRYVSRRHVGISVDEWTVLITDLHSTEGTVVERPGKAAKKLSPGEPLPLEPGSVIELAQSYQIIFEV